jgi:hypothetical protein
VSVQVSWAIGIEADGEQTGSLELVDDAVHLIVGRALAGVHPGQRSGRDPADYPGELAA